MNKVFRTRLVLIFVALTALIRFTQEVQSSFSDGGRWNTVYNLIFLQSYKQDLQNVFSADVVSIDGHFYSHQPPLQPTIAAGILGVLNSTSGIAPNYYLATLIVNGTSFLILLFFFFRLIDDAAVSHVPRIVFSVAAVFSTLAFPYSIVLSNHAPAAAALIAGHYFATRERIFLAGIILGIAGAIEPPFPALYFIFTILHMAFRREWSAAIFFIVGFLPAPLFYACFNFVISGSILPFAIRPELFNYANSPWRPDQISGAAGYSGKELASYAFNLLLGTKGFFLYSPLAIFGALALFERRHLNAQVMVLVASSFTGIAYHIVTTTNYGGFCFGIRWFVPAAAALYVAGLGYLMRNWDRALIRYSHHFFTVASALILIAASTGPYTNAEFSMKFVVEFYKGLFRSV